MNTNGNGTTTNGYYRTRRSGTRPKTLGALKLRAYLETTSARELSTKIGCGESTIHTWASSSVPGAISRESIFRTTGIYPQEWDVIIEPPTVNESDSVDVTETTPTTSLLAPMTTTTNDEVVALLREILTTMRQLEAHWRPAQAAAPTATPLAVTPNTTSEDGEP